MTIGRDARMKRAALIVAGIAVLAVLVLYWRVALFLIFMLLFAGLHSPVVLVSAVIAVGLGVLLWARRRSPPRRDE